MMLSTSNSKRQERSWLDLPSDVMANILNRIDMVDIFENVEKVCTAWLKICKDPAMWRVIVMRDLCCSPANIPRVYKDAVDRSQGQLVDVTISGAFHDSLLFYVAARSSQIRRLELACGWLDKSLTYALMKFPLLEELNLYSIKFAKEEIETIGRHCPMLKTLKVNREVSGVFAIATADENTLIQLNETAVAIGQNLFELRHLELIGNTMTNIGLQVILDNCQHLETLDLRECLHIDLKGELGKKCSKQIKYLKLPKDSLEGCPYIYQTDGEASDEDYDIESDYLDRIDHNEPLDSAFISALFDHFGYDEYM